MAIKEGDLVYDECLGIEDGVGIVLEVRRDVEVPPAVSVLWYNGIISKNWSDDITVINREERHGRKEALDSPSYI
jgi:hypothetical protein